MGHTHYFSLITPQIPDRDWLRLRRDLKVVMRDRALPPLVGPDGTGKAEITLDHIGFNGKGEDEYETFMLGRHGIGEERKVGPESGIEYQFNCCKTGPTGPRRYNLQVVMTLILLHHHSPGSAFIRTDADYMEWDVPCRLLRNMLDNPEIQVPPIFTPEGRPLPGCAPA